MSSRKPKHGVLDYFLGPGAAGTIAFSVAEAVEKGKPAVLLTEARDLSAEELALIAEKELAVLGPESFGVAAPREGIHHCLSLSPILPGRIAFVTQSGALGAAILDWAHEHEVGFSKFIALGRSPNIGLGECLDYLAEDPYTQSVLLYLEKVEDVSRFLSAARECALAKPVIVLKPGRGDGRKDGLYDAIFRRAGLLRVSRMADLFYMAEVLERQPRPKGPRLGIVTNANGPGLLAADALRLAGGELHALRDVGGEAGPEAYRRAIADLAGEEDCHGILVIVTPQPATRMADTARAIVEASRGYTKPLLGSLMGGKLIRGAEAILAEARIPTFPYPDTAAKVFERLWQYSRSLSGLYETPVFGGEGEDGTAVIAQLDGQRGTIGPALLQRLLRAYGLHWDAARSGTGLKFLVTSRPEGNFGLVMEVAAAGVVGEVYEDRVSVLPPLTSTLARRGLEWVRLARVVSAAGQAALEEMLVRVSRLVSEAAVLRELRLVVDVEQDGSLWVSEAEGALQPEGLAREHWPKCLIRPYPRQYEQRLRLRDGGEALIRPIRPEDERRIVDFHNDLSERSVYLRYLQFLKLEERIGHDRLARVCFNDYARELALVVEREDRILGVGRLQRNPLRIEEAEVAFLVRDSAQGQGIGKALVAAVVAAGRAEGLKRLTAELLADNRAMRGLLEKQGFRMRMATDGATLLAGLVL
jgi:acetyltransferase